MPQSPERKALMDAAFHVLTTNSGASLSVTEVLRAAGLSTRAFYRHFDSKDELLLALFRRDSEHVTRRLEKAVGAAATPAAALTAWVEGYLDIAADSHRRHRVIVLSAPEITRARGYDAEQRRVDAEHRDAIARILERGLADGSFPWADPEPDARSIRAALGQAFTDQMTSNAAVSADEAARQVVDLALRAVGAPPERHLP